MGIFDLGTKWERNWEGMLSAVDRLLSLLLADPLVRCEGCGEHVHPEELEAGHECYDGAHERR
jgi:hypothetical protein